MNKKRILYFALMFLPLLITVAALPFLPETIPAHYNFAGEIDRFGSKYETLLFPAITVGMGFFMLWMAKIAAKHEENGSNNEKIVFYTGMGLSVFFTIEHCYFLYRDFTAAAGMGYAHETDINQLFCVLFGIGLVITGNFMPKLRNNSLIGLRTSWSTKNDVTWKKCQLFGGISFIIIGILTVIAGIFLEGYTAMCVALGLLLTDTVICVVYSYKIAKKY
ncbi:MAG: DUF1648 domain-containing protein [Ruminococcaceae bacterium]|nr:DUF1648 domain-containing protein [Oscillospiraceae bacterium]